MRALWVLGRMRAVAPGRRALVCEAFCLLLAAKVALRWVPVRYVLEFVQREPTHPTPSSQGRSTGTPDRGETAMNGAPDGVVGEVRWGVLAVARSSPVRLCAFRSVSRGA